MEDLAERLREAQRTVNAEIEAKRTLYTQLIALSIELPSGPVAGKDVDAVLASIEERFAALMA